MGSVSSLDVIKPGEPADQLIDCVRAKANAYGIRVEDGTTGLLMVSDIGDHADDLPSFLREQLDACAAGLGYDWRDHITVAGTE
jgi:hypothetical protein